MKNYSFKEYSELCNSKLINILKTIFTQSLRFILLNISFFLFIMGSHYAIYRILNISFNTRIYNIMIYSAMFITFCLITIPYIKKLSKIK